MFFFVIMKKFGFKIVFLNLDLLSIEGTLIIHSYFSARNIEKIQNYLNCQHKNIRSTSETEKKSSISFFDIKMSRSNNKFATSIHRKPTFIEFLPTLEASSQSHMNTTCCLPQGIQTLNCSNFGIFHLEINKLKTIFENNGYPKIFAVFCIKKYLEKGFIKKEVVLKTFRKLTYSRPSLYQKKFTATENSFN